MKIDIQEIQEEDGKWVRDFIQEKWGSKIAVSRGVVHHPDALPGYLAVVDGAKQGLVAYHIDGDECEIVTLDSVNECRGIGTALIVAVRKVAFRAGCKRVWLITTNDNVKAIRFYQKRGFVLVAVHRNAIDESRKLKPKIPRFGIDGIPIRDEIEMELILKEVAA